MGFVPGIDFAESQVVDPVSCTWGDSLFYVFAFIVKADNAS